MNYFEEMIKSVKEVVKIDSVKTPPVGDKPFGEGIYKALDYSLNLGKSLGFEVINYDNYIGEIVWRGKTDEAIAVLCHLDVVPVGELSAWKYPPFSAHEEGDRIYGRGTMDDKSPAICVLYAMKELRDEGFKPTKTIKLILGCDEESGSKCIEHYNKVAKMPDVGFSPDADFPVLYAEKGILHAEFSFDYKEGLKDISGGTRVNVVCDLAQMTAPIDQKLIEKYSLEVEGEKIIAHGVTAHGSTPDKGKNAIKPLLYYLADLGIVDSEVPQKLFGDSLKLKDLSDETGNLTMSPDIIRIEDGKIVVTVDFRYPATMDGDYILSRVGEIAPIKVLSHNKPLFNDKNSPLIQTLLKIYNEETGSNDVPMAIGGGTYARSLKMGTAFGPQFVGDEETIHQPNEYVSITRLKQCYTIYKRAVKELSK